MILYAISGLGADERAFSRIKTDCEIVHIDWLKPIKNESIKSYASRLSKVIDTSKPYGLIAVSFGGLIAIEISKMLNPKIVFLISSIKTRADLPWYFRLMGSLNFLKLVPEKLMIPPGFMIKHLFGTNNPFLMDIINETDTYFAKWASYELCGWKNKTVLKNSILISGTSDRLLPITDNADYSIENGNHFMIVSKSREISAIINKYLRN